MLYLLNKVHQPQNGSPGLTQSPQDEKELHSSTGIFVTLWQKKVALKTIHYNNLLLFIQNISTFLIGSNPAVYSYTLLARIDQIWKQFVMYG